MTAQMVHYRPPHCSRAQRYRSDPHPEGHGDQEEDRAGDEHDGKGKPVAPPGNRPAS